MYFCGVIKNNTDMKKNNYTMEEIKSIIRLGNEREYSLAIELGLAPEGLDCDERDEYLDSLTMDDYFFAIN